MAFDTGPHRIELKSWISCAPFERLLNMQIVEAHAGRATLRMPFLLEYSQGAGLMHGGALAGLADTAVAMAIKSVVPPRTHFATISMQSRFLHPVRQGLVTARAMVSEHRGPILKGTATVFDEQDRPVMTFEALFKIAGPNPSQGHGPAGGTEGNGLP